MPKSSGQYYVTRFWNMRWGQMYVCLLENVSWLMTVGHSQDNYSLCFVTFWHVFWHPLGKSSVCSVDLNVTGIASELVHEIRGRMWHTIGSTLVQNDRSGSWKETNFRSWKCAIRSWTKFVAHTTENVISLEDQCDTHGFRLCFIGWVTVRFLSPMKAGEFRWVTIMN